ncbi:hypothetical protein V8F20_008281 [Naviculisporaceae sp. PSN 640]
MIEPSTANKMPPLSETPDNSTFEDRLRALFDEFDIVVTHLERKVRNLERDLDEERFNNDVLQWIVISCFVLLVVLGYHIYRDTFAQAACRYRWS